MVICVPLSSERKIKKGLAERSYTKSHVRRKEDGFEATTGCNGRAKRWHGGEEGDPHF